MDRRWSRLLVLVSGCVLAAGAATSCNDPRVDALKAQVDSLTVLVGKQHDYLVRLDQVLEAWRGNLNGPGHPDQYPPPPKPPGGY